MDETTTKANQDIREMGQSMMANLPGGVQVLIDWVILLISTLVSFFTKKSGGEAAEG